MNAERDDWGPPVTIKTGEINAALAKAQLEMHNPRFDTSNPFFKSRYASLAAVREAVIPVLAKHGIAVIQDVFNTDSGVSCITTLRHASGESVTSSAFSVPASKMDAQGLGSCVTYARRYQLMAIAGVAGDDDDDGNGATGRDSNGLPRGDGPRGLPNIDPRGEDYKNEDQEKARAMAQEFRDALAAKNEIKVWKLHQQNNKDGAFYIAVNAYMSAPERREAKEIIDRMEKNKQRVPGA